MYLYIYIYILAWLGGELHIKERDLLDANVFVRSLLLHKDLIKLRAFVRTKACIKFLFEKNLMHLYALPPMQPEFEK